MKNLKHCLNLFSTLLILGSHFFILSDISYSQVPADPVNKLTEVEVKQESLRSTTQRVKNQIAFIIEEFERNGIGGEDVQVLKTLQSVLGMLSDHEMSRIIELLKEARILDNPSVSQTKMLEAFTGQKSIMIKLKQLLEEFKRQKELYELSIFFNRLADKQNVNLKEAVALEPILQGKTLDKLTEPQKVPLQVQATEQLAIKDEALLGITKLESIAKQEITKTTELAIKALAFVKDSNLASALENAIEDLRMARLYSAIGNEKRIRDTLKELARQLIPPSEMVEALRQALRELESLISDQKAIIKQTEDLKQNSRTLDNNKEIASRQLELSDRADMLRQALKNSAPSAAENLKDSINKMYETHAILNANDGRWRAADALVREKESLSSLERAKNDLQKQVAALEGSNMKSTDPISQLKDLIGRVETLVNLQSNLVKTANDYERNNQMPKRSAELTQEQAKLKRDAQVLQAESFPVSPRAAEALNEAANQMGRAEKAFEKGKNDQFSQNYAVDSLKKAADELKRALSDRQKAVDELAGIENALSKLSDIIKDQQEINKQTASMAANPQKTDAQVTTALGRKQGETASKSQNLQGEIPRSLPEASKALSQAKDDMRQAETSLARANPSEAMPHQAGALKNLYKAKDTLENRAEELKRQLGLPEVAPQDLAQASDLINQAQDKLNSALSELLPASVLDELTKRQRDLASNIGRAAAIPASEQNRSNRNNDTHESVSSNQDLEKAQRAATEAAEKLASSDVKEAVNAMKKAESILKEAAKTSGGMNSQQSGRNLNPQSQGTQTAGSAQSQPSQGQSSDKQSTPSSDKIGQNSGARSQNQPHQSTSSPQKDTGPSLEELGNEQQEIRELAEQYLNFVEPSLNRALAKAAQSLNSASAVIGALSATASGMPQNVRQPLRKANNELMNATASAASQKPSLTRAHAQKAQEALAEASAALALAAGGKPAQMASSQQPNQNQGGQNQGQSNSNAESGMPNAGQGQDGNVSGMGSSQQRAAGQMGRSQGTSGNWYGPGGDKGPRVSADGASKFIGLPPRARDAILQSQSEKYPPDYASFIEQYMKNLSDESIPKR